MFNNKLIELTPVLIYLISIDTLIHSIFNMVKALFYLAKTFFGDVNEFKVNGMSFVMKMV